MKSIALVLGGVVVIALVTRELNWRARGLLIAGLIVMCISLMR